MITTESRNLRRLRLRHDKTQEQVADHLKISQPSYNRMERGETRIDEERLEQLAQYYNVPVSEFAREEGNVFNFENCSHGVGEIVQYHAVSPEALEQVLQFIGERLDRLELKMDKLMEE